MVGGVILEHSRNFGQRSTSNLNNDVIALSDPGIHGPKPDMNSVREFLIGSLNLRRYVMTLRDVTE